MPRPRLVPALCGALALAACKGSSEPPAVAVLPDAGQIVAVGQNGVPRFLTPGAAPGTESEVTVNAGGTVTWRFLSGGYSVVSGGSDGGCVADGVFCSPSDQGCDGGIPPQPTGSIYQHTFQSAGDYPYFSLPGCDGGMTGTVHVLPFDGGLDGGADGGP